MKVVVEVQAQEVNFLSGEATHSAVVYESVEADIGYAGMARVVNPNCRAEEAHFEKGGGMIAHLAADTVVAVRTAGHWKSWEACQKEMPAVAERMGLAVVDKVPAIDHMAGERKNT